MRLPLQAIQLIFLAPLIAIPGCATYHLSEQTGVLPIQKQRNATSETLAVCDFSYVPQNSNDTPFEPGELERWQRLVVEGLDQADIFGEVVTCSGEETPVGASYVLSGRITRFRFQKNWVPTFFPVHLGLSFFTFTGYTLFGGPTTFTIVRFAVQFELRRADTRELVVSLDKNYRSTRAVNIYSRAAQNPYDNPNMVFAEILGSVATSIALALPDEPEERPAPAQGPALPPLPDSALHPTTPDPRLPPALAPEPAPVPPPPPETMPDSGPDA